MEHEGVILIIKDNTIYVKIQQVSSCNECHAKGMCSIADVKEKIVEIPYDGGDYKPGDEIYVVGKASMGMKAVFYSFAIPLILLLTVLFAVNHYFQDEKISCFAALAMLIVYYIILYLLKDRFSKEFVFSVKKKD